MLINIPRQRAGIFLSNRTYYKDERAQWIKDRDALIEIMKKELVCEMVDQGNNDKLKVQLEPLRSYTEHFDSGMIHRALPMAT